MSHTTTASVGTPRQHVDGVLDLDEGRSEYFRYMREIGLRASAKKQEDETEEEEEEDETEVEEEEEEEEEEVTVKRRASSHFIMDEASESEDEEEEEELTDEDLAPLVAEDNDEEQDSMSMSMSDHEEEVDVLSSDSGETTEEEVTIPRPPANPWAVGKRKNPARENLDKGLRGFPDKPIRYRPGVVEADHFEVMDNEEVVYEDGEESQLDAIEQALEEKRRREKRTRAVAVPGPGASVHEQLEELLKYSLRNMPDVRDARMGARVAAGNMAAKTNKKGKQAPFLLLEPPEEAEYSYVCSPAEETQRQIFMLRFGHAAQMTAGELLQTIRFWTAWEYKDLPVDLAPPPVESSDNITEREARNRDQPQGEEAVQARREEQQAKRKVRVPAKIVFSRLPLRIAESMYKRTYEPITNENGRDITFGLLHSNSTKPGRERFFRTLGATYRNVFGHHPLWVSQRPETYPLFFSIPRDVLMQGVQLAISYVTEKLPATEGGTDTLIYEADNKLHKQLLESDPKYRDYWHFLRLLTGGIGNDNVDYVITANEARLHAIIDALDNAQLEYCVPSIQVPSPGLLADLHVVLSEFANFHGPEGAALFDKFVAESNNADLFCNYVEVKSCMSMERNSIGNKTRANISRDMNTLGRVQTLAQAAVRDFLRKEGIQVVVPRRY